MAKVSDNTTVGECRQLGLKQLVESLGGRIKLGRFLRIRFVYNRNGLPDVPDEMTLGEFRRLTEQGKTSIIIDDEGGGMTVKSPKSPELV